MMVRLHHLVFVLHLALSGCVSPDLPLPFLSTDHYSGFVEQIFDFYGPTDEESTGVSLVWVSKSFFC